MPPTSSKNSKKPTRVVAYARVSTDKQASEGVSLEAQEKHLRAYAQLFDLEIVALEIDAGESAKSLKRPGLQRALERLDRFEADGLLVCKLDRLTRSVRDLCELVDTYFRDGDYSLLSVGEQIDTRSAAGRMMLNMLTVIGQWEREAIGERTKVAMAHLKEQGLFTGGDAPYGFKVEGCRLVEEPSEQDVIARARNLRSSGLSLRRIAAVLPPNRSGTVFQPIQVARML